MESIARNVNRKNADLRFFEFGNTYCFQKERRSPEIIPGVSKSTEPNVIKHVLDAYSEDYHLGLWLTGKRINGSWAHPDEDASIYELKAYMMNIFARTGVKVQNLVFADGDQDIYRRSLVIKNKGGKVFATIGVVSSDIQKLYDLDNEVYYADINWKLLMKSIHNNIVSFTEISRFPVVSRDLALLVDKEIEFAQIEQIAYNVERKFLKEVRLFDVYEGKNLEAGKKSYAVNFLIQDEQKTLTDKQIDSIMTKIVTALTTQLQAKLR
jgi:phenylalanyl-tRNA synthetase beta chain